MKALVLQQFSTLVVEDLPDPVAGTGQVLVNLIATGICGSDLHGFTGANGRRVPGQVMGHETVGRVSALGAGVDGPPVGTLVTINPVVVPAEDAQEWAGREHQHPGKTVIGVAPDIVSAFAQTIAVPARNVVPLPTGMSPDHGALVEPVAVAVHAVQRAGAAGAPSALVVGGGPIGQSLVLALRRAGVDRVVVSEIEPARRDVVEQLGATAVDPSRGPVPGQVRQRLGRPAAIAFDAVGISASLADALGSSAPGATVCLVGMGRPRLELDAYAVSTAERTLVGSFTYSAHDFRTAVDVVAAAGDAADVLISRTVALADAPAAFTALAAGDGTPGKVLVRLQERV